MTMVQMAEKTADAEDNHSNYGINQIDWQISLSTRTHNSFGFVDAESAHQLEKFLIDIGSAKFNSSKNSSIDKF